MEKRRESLSRRNFMKSSAAAGVAAASVMGVTAPSRAYGANERIRIGFIGPGGRGFGAHVKSLCKLREAGVNVDLTAVSDVYSVQQNMVAEYILKNTGIQAKRYENYEDMLADGNVDAVCIATPDHWHAKQTIDAMKAGKHVYCEKPMTHTVDEALAVVSTWKATGQGDAGRCAVDQPAGVGQVPRADPGGPDRQGHAVADGIQPQLHGGPVALLQVDQGHDAPRPSIGGVGWGWDYGLAPEMPFDRAVYAQWRCYWPFGSGMYTDLFVHRTTGMLKATGLRYPGRVVGAGGIFLEYDTRDVPDVATVVADFNEGCQLLISSTMCNAETPIPQVIRGHFGSLVFPDKSSKTPVVDFLPERPQITLNSKLKAQRFEVPDIGDQNQAHFKNFVDAVAANKPEMVNNPPDLGAAAIVVVNLGVQSYREGKAFFFKDNKVCEADASWAQQWEAMSKQRAKPRHVPGWKAGDTGSLLQPPEYMTLAGPWIDGKDPAP